jgi:hypothetical protein
MAVETFLPGRECWIMNVFKYLLLKTACLLATVSVTGCLVTFEETAAIAEIEIDSPPPAPPKVVVSCPPRPSAHHVWIGGHHIVNSGTWVWVHGHWAKPPRKDAVWMPCHTRRKSEIWVWTPGYWY